MIEEESESYFVLRCLLTWLALRAHGCTCGALGQALTRAGRLPNARQQAFLPQRFLLAKGLATSDLLISPTPHPANHALKITSDKDQQVRAVAEDGVVEFVSVIPRELAINPILNDVLLLAQEV